MTAEQLVAKLTKKGRKYEWEKTRDRNEALDCRVYARAAASAVGMDRFTEEDWLSLAGVAGIEVSPARESEGTDAPAQPSPSRTTQDDPPRRKTSFL
jgi:phage terminase large subunit GpA-like protein